MSTRYIRMRHFNKTTNVWDSYFPQTTSSNILRRDGGGVLEKYLNNYDEHIFSGKPHLNHAVSTGTHRLLSVTMKNVELVDGYSLLLTIHTLLGTEPQLNFNETGYKYILNGAGERIPGGQVKGAIMLLVYSKAMDSWIMVSGDNFNEVTKVMMPTVSEYNYEVLTEGEHTFIIPGFDSNTMLLEFNYGQTILRPGIDYYYPLNNTSAVQTTDINFPVGELLHFRITSFEKVTKRNNVTYELEIQDYALEATEDGQVYFAIPTEAVGSNYLTLNYQQTILRNGIDYELLDNNCTVHLIQFGIDKDESIILRTVKMIESNGVLYARNWGSTGHYTNQLKILRGAYTAEHDGVVIVPVPNYDMRHDDITVIRDNLMLIRGTDYEIDELGQIVLVNDALDTGYSVHWTIIKAGLFDTPNFFFTDAKGQSGQHILIDVSYETLTNEYMLLVKLKHDLLTGPTLKCVEGPAEPILDCFGNMVQGGYKAGSYLWLIYDYESHVWYSMSHSQIDVTGAYPVFNETEGEANFIGGQAATIGDPNDLAEVAVEHNLGSAPTTVTVTPSEPPTVDLDTGERQTIGDIWTHWDDTYIYVGNTGTSTSKFHWTASNSTGTADLRTYVNEVAEELRHRPGNVITHYYVHEVTDPNVRNIDIPDYDYISETLLVVNIDQRVLRDGIDYEKTYSGITLDPSMELAAGDIVQFMYVDNSMIEASTSGIEELRDYVYWLRDYLKDRPANISYRVLSYSASGNNVRRIPFGELADDEKIAYVVYGQTMLTEGVDYTTYEGGIDLLNFGINAGDAIYATALKVPED